MKYSIIILFAALSIAGCAGNGADQPGSPGFKEASAAGSSKVRSEFTLSKMVRRSATRQWEGKSVVIYLAHPDSAASVSGGAITLNGVNIPKHVRNGITWYQTLNTDTVPLTFDGSYHAFNVPGAAGFPPMSDSIQAPTGETAITFPAPGDTISKSTGFTLTWGPADAVTGVYITISDTSTAVGTPHEINRTLTANSGSMNIPPADLANLATGPVTISVVRGNIRQRPLNATQDCQFAVYSSYAIQAVLRP